MATFDKSGYVEWVDGRIFWSFEVAKIRKIFDGEDVAVHVKVHQPLMIPTCAANGFDSAQLSTVGLEKLIRMVVRNELGNTGKRSMKIRRLKIICGMWGLVFRVETLRPAIIGWPAANHARNRPGGLYQHYLLLSRWDNVTEIHPKIENRWIRICY
uniref:Uncharacterized protein n=1 Tax=Nelumbo nucifera TaxID=4432 RepID=A0A822YYR3_NELNU|nr:TPA_asm: hypothetical protein HUJ06_008004 [Nelumbo nucifera]